MSESNEGGFFFALIVAMLLVIVGQPYKPTLLFFTEECYWAEGYITDKEIVTDYLSTDYYLLFNGTFDNESHYEGRVHVSFITYLYVPVGWAVEGEEFCQTETLNQWIRNGNLSLNQIG
tara:strand:- start:25203 stop:25559 length:357 start_codon:yes stop_codon:yes gene_type:complete